MVKKPWLYPAFFVSGASGIIYQILWVRQLSLVFGGVTLVIASVTSVILLGLAVGAWLGGKLADKFVNQAKFYLLVEVSTAVLGVINWWGLSRFNLVAAGLVLLQAVVMGMTWPLMFKLLLGRSDDWRVAGNVSLVNILGASSGAIVAGYLLLANWGLPETLVVAVGANLVAGLAVGLLAGRQTIMANSQPTSRLSAVKVNRYWLVLVLFFAGSVGMALEMVWLRLFALIVGGSVYAFSLVLALVLLGLALGGLVSRKINLSQISLGWLLWLEAGLILTGLLLAPQLPHWLVGWYQRYGNTFWPAQGMRLVLVSSVVLLPSLISGTILPLGVSLVKSSWDEAGSKAGWVYFLNTLGAVSGGWLGAVVLVPQIGLNWSLVVLAGVLVSLALVRVRPVAVLALLVLMSWWGLKNWNKLELVAGAFLYGPPVLDQAANYKLLFYQDGREATISVIEHQGTKILKLNGKADASNDQDMGTQAVLGHVPVLLHQNPKRVLVIGLGSGVTAGAISRHSRVGKLVVAEIEPAVVEAARTYFKEENYEVLDNPKLELVINDARNYLLDTDESFEVITSEPSNPWQAGENNLFTREFFELGKSRLTPDGVFFQWLHLYNLRPEEVKSIAKTFTSVFPYVQVWTSTNPLDLFLAGKTEPFILNWDRFQEALSHGGVRASLARRGFSDEIRLFSLLWSGNNKIREWAQDGELNTDQQPILEFRAPYGLYQDTAAANFDWLLNLHQADESLLPIVNQPREAKDDLDRARKARRVLVEAAKTSAEGNLDAATALAETGLEVDPNAPSLKRILAKMYADINNFERAIGLNPGYYPAYTGLAAVYLQTEQKEAAEALLADAVNRFAWSGELLMYQGILAGMNEDWTLAEDKLTQALELEPNNFLIHNNLANLYLQQGDRQRAIQHWRASLKLKPNQASISGKISLTENFLRLIKQ